MTSQPAADGPDFVLSRTAFMVAWTLASLVPWIATTLLWRVNYDVALADGAASVLFGANPGELEADRAYRILHTMAYFLGTVLAVLIEARLLRQFRDDTRWWWILGIAAALVMELLYAVVLTTPGNPLTIEAVVLRVSGYLLWAGMAWRLIRLWGWRDRYWLAFNVVIALALPLVDRLCGAVPHWAMVLYARAGVGDYAARYVLGELMSGLIGAILVAGPMAWLLWHHVVVHRRVAASPPAR